MFVRVIGDVLCGFLNILDLEQEDKLVVEARGRRSNNNKDHDEKNLATNRLLMFRLIKARKS